METKYVTIKDYVLKNKEILSAVGIIGALVILLANLSISWIAYLLSLFMTLSLILVWSEIDTKKDETDNLKLISLKYFFKFSLALLIFHTLLKYRVASWYCLFIPILILLLYLFAQLLRKSNKIIDIFKSKKLSHKIISVIITTVLIAISLLLAWPISIPLNQALDEIDHLNSKINLY